MVSFCYNKHEMCGGNMKKIELLSPVSNMEALYQAIHNGCDAVYLGGKQFGARKFAPNLSLDELKEAVSYAHLYGVRMYVTVNTLVKTNEMDSFLDYVRYLYEIGVDALIMQDLGMIMRVRTCFPDFEIHASTQVHNQNERELRVLEKLGVKRVVLARELSLSEIDQFDTSLELEVFIHGALCVCYSGCCLFSSMVGGRSGNRGECAGSCRLPYQLLEDGREVSTPSYLLSMKELNTSHYMEDILKSSITSLKIEGRMKSPEYVGFITKFYRTLIDSILQKKPFDYTIWEEQLQTLFTRGFTKGYLFLEEDKQIVNKVTPNHIGLPIGKVLSVTSDKIKILLEHDLNQGDGIRFLESGKGMIVNFLYHEKGKLVSSALKGDTVFVDNKVDLATLDSVSKTMDCVLVSSLKNYEEKKIPVTFMVKAKLGHPIEVMIQDDLHTIQVVGDMVQEAKSAPISEERIKLVFSKLGNTPFTLKDIEIEMDDSIFLPIAKLNDIRRDASKLLIEARRKSERSCSLKEELYPSIPIEDTNRILISLHTEEQLEVALHHPEYTYVVSSLALYDRYSMKIPHLFYKMPRVCTGKIDYSHYKHLVVTELGGLLQNGDHELVGDYFLNVCNPYSVYFYHSFGLRSVCLSPEMVDEEIPLLISQYESLFAHKPNLEKVIYGRYELMIMKYSPLAKVRNTVLLHQHQYALKDRKGEVYPLMFSDGVTHIFHSKCIDDLSHIPFYQEMGITNFRMELYRETKEEMEELLKRFQVFV